MVFAGEAVKVAPSLIRVVFTSDNGGMATSNLAEQIPTSNIPLRAGKGYLYEGGIRVPLIVRWPKNIESGSRSAFPVTGTDLYPTVLDMAGLKTMSNQHRDGISLKPLLRGEKMKKRTVCWYFPHYSGGLGGRPSAAIREGHYKLVHYFETNQSELYGLENDREEPSDISVTSFPK